MAMARPPRDMRLAERPTWFMTTKVSRGVRMRVAMTMMEERRSPRKRKRMMATRATPSRRTLETVARAASTSSERS
jgi:hypothetical protein